MCVPRKVRTPRRGLRALEGLFGGNVWKNPRNHCYCQDPKACVPGTQEACYTTIKKTQSDPGCSCQGKQTSLYLFETQVSHQSAVSISHHTILYLKQAIWIPIATFFFLPNRYRVAQASQILCVAEDAPNFLILLPQPECRTTSIGLEGGFM